MTAEGWFIETNTKVRLYNVTHTIHSARGMSMLT